MSTPDRATLLDMSLAEFLDSTAARQATPGGGAVAALSLALAAAMARMVTGYSTRGERPELEELLHRLAEIDLAARRCVEDDVTAYANYRESRSGTVEQQQAATLQAIAVPLKCLELAHDLTTLLDTHKAGLNLRLASDTHIAAQLAEAAARGAVETVLINLFDVADEAKRRNVEACCATLLPETATAARSVCAFVPD